MLLKKFLPHKESGIFEKAYRWIIVGIVGLALFSLIAVSGTVAILSIGLPDVTNIESLSAAQSTEIFDRGGAILYTVHGAENREFVGYENISQYLIDATVSIEDDSFWEHGGFDFWALGKVALHEVFGIGSARGGSTITQQYIKNTFLSPERSYIRKAKELILAIRLERAFSKKEILELYLNRIPYGNNAFGCSKAAEIYFNKTTAELDLAESAILASLPQAPGKYNPYGENKYSHLLKDFSEDEVFYRKINSEADLETKEYIRGLIGKHVNVTPTLQIYIQGRTDLILKRMVDLGKITAEQRQEALNELQITEFNEYHESIKAPHFIFYIKQILEDKYGKDVVERGGLKVYTTLDSNLQKYAEETISAQGEISAKSHNTNNIAAMTINVKNGEILSMVGSRDYFNEEIDGNVNVLLRPRQPGSSFKPIVYAKAFMEGYGPASVIYDVPTRLGADRPMDFDGRWLGQMQIREALGKSRNIPAIKAYFVAKQQDQIIDLAQKMGINALDKTHSYGYPLALGAGEIPPIEMLTAYATFANNGKRPEINGIAKVINSNGDVLEEWQPKEFEEVLDPQIAYLINSILSDQKASIGPRLFVSGKINAAKTGTSTKENKKAAGGKTVLPSDCWTIGYTPDIATVVWAGNTDGTGLALSADGYNIAAPVFTKIMTKALEKIPNTPFLEPEGIKHIQVSKASGLLPGPTTPPSMIIEEVFASSSIPTEQENLFYKVKIDKVSGLLATEYTPEDAIEEVSFQNYKDIADMFNWNKEIRDYYATYDPSKNAEAPTDENPEPITPAVRFGAPPTEYDNIHTATTAKNIPSITITSPTSNSTLPKKGVEIEIDLDAKNGVGTVEYYIDDKKVYFTRTAPYFGHLNISRFFANGSTHLITAKVIDALGYSAQSVIEIKVGGGE
ncbi:MAG: penicillin-binding protein [Candidatus Gracilibacteria bacterium]|jgi:membrane peptidoglycan carboxypeptidase